MITPRYPVFVPSKGRWQKASAKTVQFLLADGCKFRLVVEPAEAPRYAAAFPTADLLILPRDSMGLLAVRNWIRDLSISEGHDRHWQLDDNIRGIQRFYKGFRIECNANIALAVCEDFTDRYTNIGVSGLNYQMFVTRSTRVPYHLNCKVYSCSLINNRMPHKWRRAYNDDTDLCLQVVSNGMCTVCLNVFMCHKVATMKIAGGNTDDLYQDDGRLKMARSLEKDWPYVVDTKRRYNRAQHVVRGSWAGFDTPLQRRTDIDWDNMKVDEYGMRLVQVTETVRSPKLQALIAEQQS